MNGFYGNITDTSQKIFQFDRIFPNRKTMDEAAAAGADGIFTGHFVLVKYNSNGNYVLQDGRHDNEYSENYLIDQEKYGEEFDIRGYDATVWQKIYSNGVNKFISIATLNGLMPTIELNMIEPTSSPGEINFNNTSEYGYYEVDIPSRWGFRIKEADDPNKSDQQIIQTYDIYNTSGDKVGTTQRQVNADIYFNKDGFNQYQQSYSNDNNEILISATGQSGKFYNGSAKPDIEEVSIHLPALGNAVSDFYDKIYEVDSNQERKLDTQWYNGNDARKINGDSSLNGKSYDLNTISGIINTSHNRLGQIIVPLTTFPITKQELAGLSNEYIYFYNNKYYYKTEDDFYEVIIEENNSDVTYEIADVNEFNYEVNTYYIKDNQNNYVIATDSFNDYQTGTVFYQKNISAVKFNRINLIGYRANTYFYLNETNDYILDNASSPSNINQSYYQIGSSNIIGPKTFDGQYFPGSYFTQEENHYKVSYEENPNIQENTYYQVSPISLGFNKIMYQPGKYYYYVKDENNILKPVLATGSFNPIEVYYYIPLSQTGASVYINGQTYYGYLLDEDNKIQVTLSDPAAADGEQIFIFDASSSSYIPYEEDTKITIQKEYFILNIEEISSFFFPNTYYTYEERNGQFGYYLAQSFGNTDTSYYELINIQALTTPFYESNKYYYYNGTSYLIDVNNSITNNRVYYIETPLCVYNDTSGRYPRGYEWNENALFVPASVTLATKEKRNKLVELKGINNGESSLNGSLLQFNRITNFNDEDSRDITTIQGTLNHLNDKIYNMQNLQPKHLLYVNEFGQITSSNYTIDDLRSLLD